MKPDLNKEIAKPVSRFFLVQDDCRLQYNDPDTTQPDILHAKHIPLIGDRVPDLR